jgi:hypothetical protein
MSAEKHQTVTGVDGLIAQLEPYFTQKSPVQLPDEWRRRLADWSWIAALVVGLISVPAALALFGLSGFVGVIAASVGVNLGPWLFIANLFMVAEMVLLFLSVPGLKAKQAQGWKYALYGELLSAVYAVMTLSMSNWIGKALGVIISLWFLFQIKREFK